MTTADDLDARIRSMVLELLDAAPPAPALPQLEDQPPRRRRHWHRIPTGSWLARAGRRRPLAGIGLALAGIGVLVAALVAVESGPPAQVTEATLGMQVTGYSWVATTPALPPSYQVVATGTAFGRPWVVAGPPPSSGRIGEWLAYAGKTLISGDAPLGAPTTDATGSRRPRAALHLGVGLALDDQRFLVGASNGPVATVTVRAKGGTVVSGSVLPHRLGTTRFFVLSLGRQGDCHQLCQGAVTVSVANRGGRVLATRTVSDFEGLSTYLDAPPVTQTSGHPR
jgi:hypothetical protein